MNHEDRVDAEFASLKSTKHMLPSTCANPHLEWGCLPPMFIGEFVHVLKRMRRWKSDGPSLRLLNRHWSHHISENVVEVRPHHSRKMDREKDTSSLLKFPRLTSVDISRFLDDSPSLCCAFAAERRGTPPESELHANCLKNVVDVLVRLPYLSQIEVSCWTLILCHFHAREAKEQWARMPVCFSLFVYHCTNPKLYVEVPFSTCLTWLAPCSEDVMKHLGHVAGGFRSLKNLEVYVHRLCPTQDLTFLSGIESVKIQKARTVEWLSHVSCRLAIASVELQNPTAGCIDALAKATGLESLKISSPIASHLSGHKLSALFGGLKVLILQNTALESRLIADAFFLSVTRLEDLRLQNFEFNGGAVTGNLPHRRALTMEYCELRDLDLSFLRLAGGLRSLAWNANLEGPHTVLPSSLVVANLPPTIESLYVKAFVDDALLASIVRRTNLEVLSIAVDRKMTLQRLQELEKLPKLRILRIDFYTRMPQGQIVAFLSLGFFARLEQLWIQRLVGDSRDVDKALTNLQARAPRLLIETQYSRNGFLGRGRLLGPLPCI